MTAGAGPVDVLVVGAGLSGLVAATDLVAAGRSVTVVEARARVGGRTMTVRPVLGSPEWFDLGATWHWPGQPLVRALAADLGVDVFEQAGGRAAVYERHAGVAPEVVPLPPADPAWRFVGGAQALCERLTDRLPDGTVVLERAVTAVEDAGTHLVVTTRAATGVAASVEAAAVVIAVPPRLVLQDVEFAPALPTDVVEAMEATPTWMGNALKCVAVYEGSPWLDAGHPGSAFSDVGPLEEAHDASVPGGPGALWGFVALDYDVRSLEPDDRVPLVLEQLGRLFGPEAADPVQYVERDWSLDPWTCEEEHRHLAPVPYGASLFARALAGGRLHWAGTETAAHGGHLEGAVHAGRRAAEAVLAAGRGPARA